MANGIKVRMIAAWERRHTARQFWQAKDGQPVCRRSQAYLHAIGLMADARTAFLMMIETRLAPGLAQSHGVIGFFQTRV